MPKPEPSRRKASIIAGVLAAILLGGGLIWSVLAESRQGALRQTQGPPVFDAEWVRLPTPDDVEAAYPARAKAAAFTERVSVRMRCAVGEIGGLTDCAIEHESISGWGFGEAALALSPTFGLKTVAADGSSLVGLPITVPLGFDPIFAPSQTTG